MANLNFDNKRMKSTPFFYFINYINVLHDNFLKENFKNITPRDFTYLSNIFYHENISQKELADLTGIDQSDISKIERGASNPTLGTLERIANALGGKLVISIETEH